MGRSDWTLALATTGVKVGRGLAKMGRDGTDGGRGGSFNQTVAGEGGASASCWIINEASLASSAALALHHICRLWSRVRLNSSSSISDSVQLSSSEMTGADIIMQPLRFWMG